MGTCNLTYIEKQKIEILKLYFLLEPYWNYLYYSHSHYKELFANLPFVDCILINKLTNREKEIILKGLIRKNKGNEYIGAELYYSESGLRNQINIVCKKLIVELDDLSTLT